MNNNVQINFKNSKFYYTLKLNSKVIYFNCLYNLKNNSYIFVHIILKLLQNDHLFNKIKLKLCC